jgi:hypothetical protein
VNEYVPVAGTGKLSSAAAGRCDAAPVARVANTVAATASTAHTRAWARLVKARTPKGLVTGLVSVSGWANRHCK